MVTAPQAKSERIEQLENELNLSEKVSFAQQIVLFFLINIVYKTARLPFRTASWKLPRDLFDWTKDETGHGIRAQGLHGTKSYTLQDIVFSFCWVYIYIECPETLLLFSTYLFVQINLESRNKALSDLQDEHGLAIAALKEKESIISHLKTSGLLSLS